MAQKINQLEVFIEMVKAMEEGKQSKVKKADKLIRKALLENRKKEINGCGFSFSSEEIAFIKKLCQ